MSKYLLKRVGLIFLTLLIILTLVFFLLKLIPDYPPLDPNLPPEKYKEMLAKYGYDKPIFIQYFRWLKNVIFRFDWGVSRHNITESAFSKLSVGLKTTLSINLLSLVISMPLGFVLGIIAALRKNKIADHIITFFVMMFISIPSFVIIIFLIFSLGKWGLVPIQFNQLNFEGNSLLKYVIPVLALSFGPIAALTRYTRSELSEVLTSDYLALAKTKGLNKYQLITRHALRNSMIPLIGIVIGNFVGILSGSVIIEQMYGVPGMGGVLVNSISTLDYDVTMVTLAFYTLIGLFAILLLDMSYGIIDPRIRMGAKKQ